MHITHVGSIAQSLQKVKAALLVPGTKNNIGVLSQAATQNYYSTFQHYINYTGLTCETCTIWQHL